MDHIEESWGRKVKASWWASFASIFVVIACPSWLFWNWMALEYFEGSYALELSAVRQEGLTTFAIQYLPRPSWEATAGYAIWLLFQAGLYQYLPGPTNTGQLTPAGLVLEYRTNGLLAWIVTHSLAIVGVYSGLGSLKATAIADHWEGLLVISNIYGFILSFLVLVKGYIAPSFPCDCKYSGSIIADFFIGVELNPRLGRLFDLKFFHNERPGIVGWILIDLSFAAVQWRDFGYISNSMAIVILLHTIYVLDLFVNEAWYLKTLDMCHDHFGFYLGWGSMAALPSVYTIQCQYLARNPTDLSTPYATLTLLLGLSGYAIFRSANSQKDIIRSSNGRSPIWGRPPRYKRCAYKTEDGRHHESILLHSGWWGLARHSNYLGDLMHAFALGLACRSSALLPWAYTFFLTSLIFNRLPRDEARCRRKYGEAWKEYCGKVPWRILPGVY